MKITSYDSNTLQKILFLTQSFLSTQLLINVNKPFRKLRQIDRTKDQPTEGHEGSKGSYTFNKNIKDFLLIPSIFPLFTFAIYFILQHRYIVLRMLSKPTNEV